MSTKELTFTVDVHEQVKSLLQTQDMWMEYSVPYSGKRVYISRCILEIRGWIL